MRFTLSSATIADINTAFDAKLLTAQQLLALYAARIDAFDQRGPCLNSMLSLNPTAMSEAERLDDERQNVGPRSVLHGIPVVLKDLFDVQGLPTTGGFSPLANSIPRRDSSVVKRLRSAGMIVLGKNNLTDWFGDPDPEVDHTIGGRTLNPYNLVLSAGRSSSGTGASIAAAFCTVGIGSETGVSVRNPAVNNNLFGIVATAGLVPRAGQLIGSFSQERPGILARNVYDMAAVLSVIAGFDPEDLATAASIGRLPQAPYTSFLAAHDLRDVRFGVFRDLFRCGEVHQASLDIIDNVLKRLKGSTSVLDPLSVSLDLLDDVMDLRTSIEEARYSFDWYFSRLPMESPIHSFAELVDRHSDKIWDRLVGQRFAPALDANTNYAQKLTRCRALRRLAVRLMDHYSLDCLIYPFKTEPAPPIGFNALESDNAFSAVTGLPAVVMPIGFIDALNAPVGIEILGRPWSESTLLRIARGFEATLVDRRLPSTTPSLPGECFDI